MPIREYENGEKGIGKSRREGGIPVTVKIHSTQRDMTGTGFFGEAASLGENPDEILQNAEKTAENAEAGVYVLTTEGSLFSCGGELSLEYEESSDEDDERCRTRISVSSAEPKYVTVTREGSFCTVFAAEEGKRQYSVYKTPFGNLEMCVYAKRVDNRISENGGILILDYAVELKGMTAQRTKMRVDVKVKS